VQHPLADPSNPDYCGTGVDIHPDGGVCMPGAGSASGSTVLQVRARWYDPQTGRFVSEDPIGLAGGINPYAYVGSNPVNGRDPYGLYPICRYIRGVTIGIGNSTESFPGYWECEEVYDWWNTPQGGDPISTSSCAFIPRKEPQCGPMQEPTSGQRAKIQSEMREIRTDVEFCAMAKHNTQQMLNRHVAIWPNDVKFMYAESPYDPARGGPILYMYSGGINSVNLVHEGMHKIPRPLGSFDRMAGMRHRDPTPLGVTMWDAAFVCVGQKPRPMPN
jgi:RHS repeat-associated protein